MEGRSKLKIGRKEAHDTSDPWPNLEIKRSEVKVIRLLNAVTENHPHLHNAKAYELQTGYMEYDDPHHRHAPWPLSKLKALDDCSSHHLQAAGVYRGGRATGRTACLRCVVVDVNYSPNAILMYTYILNRPVSYSIIIIIVVVVVIFIRYWQYAANIMRKIKKKN